jgi:methylase of polypeptide subunit release factors
MHAKTDPAETATPDQPQRNPGMADDAALLRLAHALKERGYRFITVSPATHARVNSRPGNEWATGIEGVFGWSRPFRPEVLPAEIFALMRDAGAAVRDGDGWRSLVRLSTLEDQLFVHSAYPTVDDDAVFFGPDTYRFASAVSRHLSLRTRAVRRVADIGCGAGVGAIMVALEQPGAEVMALDINDAALRLTAVNATLAGASNVVARNSDLLHGVDGAFDLIIANPPYLIDPEERQYRHGKGELGEGLSIAIVEAALDRLAPGGVMLLYTGSAIVDGVDRFKAAVAARLEKADIEWRYHEIDPDVFGEELLTPAYARADRIAAVLVTARK